MTPAEAADRSVRGRVAVEAAGNIRALETAVELTARGRRTITVGLPPPDARLRLSPLSLARDMPAFIGLWREVRLPLESLISSTIGLDDINAGMDRHAAGTELRQLIAFDDTESGV
jgi:alcohol dehydrogenase